MSTRRVTLIGFFAAIVLAVPMGVLASHQFTDVPDDYPYHADIDALVDSGVTGGCGGGKYCPASFVTRGQMAAFLNRLGALGPGKTPVANAATVDFWDANELNRAAYNSTSNLLDGDVAAAGSLTVSITAPAPGWLLINGHGEVYNEGNPDQGTMTCRLEVDNVVLPGTTTDIDTQYTDAGAVDLDETECSATAGYEVCGGAHSVEYAVLGLGVEENVFDAGVTVQYVPFNGVGNPKSIFGCIIIIPGDEQVDKPAKE
jgi:hypothetical protein